MVSQTLAYHRGGDNALLGRIRKGARGRTSTITLVAPLALLTLATTLTGCAAPTGLGRGWPFSSTSSFLIAADDAEKGGRLDEAIQNFDAHLAYRLSNTERPRWENPYFYKLKTGDLKLKKGDPTAALADYKEAEQQGVTKELVGDRYRFLAEWYIGRKELQPAFDLAMRHREIDPLLFDALLDRISKLMVAREERGAASPELAGTGHNAPP